VDVLAISDVPGNAMDLIGSGPFHPDPTSFADALAVVKRFDFPTDLPRRVLDYLNAGAAGKHRESPKRGEPGFDGVHGQIVASSEQAVAAALQQAAATGIKALSLGRILTGDAAQLGRRLAALAMAIQTRDPLCLIAAGETTVRVTGNGRGGRSQELALSAALGLRHRRGAALLAAGTDGTDGPTDAAGAYVDSETLARATQQGLDPDCALAKHDSYTFFDAEGGLLRTGPTETNVMDLALLWIPGDGA
jgi:glycerate-2-kinase